MKTNWRRVRAAGRVAVVAALLAWGNGAQASFFDDIAGNYVGQWDNTTFGSTGSITIDVVSTPSTVTMTVDLGGFVFGLADPPPITLPFTISGNQATLNIVGDPLLGDLSVTIGDDGSFSATETNLPTAIGPNPGPGLFINSFVVTGNITTTPVPQMAFNYTVNFLPTSGGGSALGTAVATVVPEPTGFLIWCVVAPSVLSLRRRFVSSR